MNRSQFLDFDVVEIKTGFINLLVPKTIGPRIISLSIEGGSNLFAELPNDYLEYPGEENFYFYGGHRLWLGPENPFITYKPDSQPVNIIETPGLLKITQDLDDVTGIQKSIHIRLTNFENVVIIDHYIHNAGEEPLNCAPWAITQFRLGGIVIIPQQIHEGKENKLLPDRSIVLWPYSDINDPRIHWGNQFIFINTEPLDKALKIGVVNNEKWMAYFYDNLLFIKYADNYESKQMIDNGATSECYCNSKFAELETLGPLTKLEPGQTIRHREIWRVEVNPFDSITFVNMADFVIHDEMADICLNML